MGQFRTSADYADLILSKCGEPTNGNSSYEADVLLYLNKIHHVVIAGGNIFDMDVNDTWTWARAKRPMVIELQPAYTTGSVSITAASEAGTFSSAPSYSVQGWYFRATGDSEIYRIVTHSAAGTAFELDGAYVGSTDASAAFTVFKLEYDLVPSYLVIEANVTDRIDLFDVAAQTQIQASLTAGSYTPADLATHVATQLTASASVAVWSGAYSSITRKFTFTSDLSGGATRQGWLAATGTGQARSALALLGFDDENTAATNTAALVSTYPLGGVSRLVEPFRKYQNSAVLISSVDLATMSAECPLQDAKQGMPTRFAVVSEDSNGLITVRFDKYPEAKTRIEVDYVPVPRDLKDNAVSAPLIPRKYADVLEYGASAYLLADKEDDKAAAFMQIAQRALQSMQRNNRSQLFKAGSNFGRVAREDRSCRNPRRLSYGYTGGDD